MSPPAAAAAPAVRRARTAAPSRPRSAPRPRRVSGPARPQQPATPLEQSQRGVARGLLSGLDRLQRHRLLDRLIAGRTWIALVAFALIGIVTLQLLLLTLNGDIGRALEREALLQRENAAMSIEDSELAAGERVEAQAAHLGMQLVPAGALRFLDTTPPGVLTRAAASLSSPLQDTSTGTASAAGSEAGAGTQTGAGEATAAPDEATPAAQSPTSAEAAAGTSAGGQTPAPSTAAAGGEATAAGAPAATAQPGAGEQASAATAGAGAATPAGGTQASPAG